MEKAMTYLAVSVVGIFVVVTINRTTGMNLVLNQASLFQGTVNVVTHLLWGTALGIVISRK